MENASIACPKCRLALAPAEFNPETYSACPNCLTELKMETFPALLAPPAPIRAGEAIVMEGEASCFYHPAKKAVIPCANCGRFLCALCDIDLHGDHYCPSCIESGRSKGKFSALTHEHTHYDDLALTLAVAGFLTCGLTAPVALYLAIRYWKRPGGPIPRSKVRLILALFFAVLAMAATTVVVVLNLFEN